MLIQINLLPGPSRKKKTGGGGGFKLPDMKELVGKVKDPALAAGVVVWIAGGLVLGFLWLGANRTLAGLQNEKTQVEAEARRFQNLIRQKRRAEALRDSLVAELNAIRRIDADRYIWPHIMDEVTKALPDYTWLVALNVLGGGAAPRGRAAADEDVDPEAPTTVRFGLEGRTSDLSAYTRFVRQLSNSPWLTNVQFGAAQSVIEEGREVKAFSITGTFRVADSAYIRTVPLRASVQ